MIALLLVAQLAVPPVELAPATRYDPRIPTLRSVTGHETGDEISTPDQITAYLRALAAAAPDRTRLVEYARTWEGRPLHTLVIGAPGRMARLEAIKADLRRLADPRTLSAADAERLVHELPVVTWLIHAVHGNEISSSDAALAEAYHLLAAQGDADVDTVLRESIVLIDPLANPDGRARFVAQNLQGRAATPDPEPLSAEHDEPWPGGRANHYLFDMNRDWFAVSQPETQGRVATHLEWYPHVVVDLHEMGGESTYYFAPPALPANPLITARQQAWLDVFGRANAARFDERGFAYFVKEVYDAFYPGYGDSWPVFQGAVGMTFEQASARGLAYRRSDDTLLTYEQGILHHFTSAITTAVTAARNREKLLRDFLEYRRTAVAEGQGREYLIPPGDDPPRAVRLAQLLARQGLEVFAADEPVRAGARTLPAGTFVVPMGQPGSRLLRNLLEPTIAMDPKFVTEQERRRRKRLSDEIYDITAWSLPLAFDVEVVSVDRPTGARTHRVDATTPPVSDLAPARVAYFIPWGVGGAAAVAEALQGGIHVRSADLGFTQGGHAYPAGTAIVRVAENAPDLRARLGPILARHAVTAAAVDSGWIEEGISLGSRQVHGLKPPRVVLAWDAPTESTAAGWARWVLERRYGQPVTAVRVASLGDLELARYDVLVLPSGDYTDAIGDELVRRIREWVRAGGTLVTLADASRWAARTKVGLLSTHTELKGGRPEVDLDEKEKEKEKEKEATAEPATPFDLEKAIQPERERPEALPGALLRVDLDREHWLSAGLDGTLAALVEGQRVFTPIKLDAGVNVGLYAPRETLVVSGVVWPEAKDQLARKAFLIHQPMGEGHIVAFAEEPNFRGYTEATELLFMNAVLLGPAH
jgi:zinc carboxypeptidase